ncbi:hypothetical protein VTK73DRAFT_3817 [Phialemonium thermophilum]|uniref:Uncharacterized protein n=1 Tax=Phialemonium thermophilum TaxID=223376 RepID=A0ABR3VEP5_9PEZI
MRLLVAVAFAPAPAPLEAEQHPISPVVHRSSIPVPRRRPVPSHRPSRRQWGPQAQEARGIPRLGGRHRL